MYFTQFDWAMGYVFYTYWQGNAVFITLLDNELHVYILHIPAGKCIIHNLTGQWVIYFLLIPTGQCIIHLHNLTGQWVMYSTYPYRGLHSRQSDWAMGNEFYSFILGSGQCNSLLELYLVKVS